jgi:hypothetical protein
MKMLCSGNPNHKTIAGAIKVQFPDADFASRATGYDLRFWDVGSETHFRENIKNYNIFINSSFICGGGQLHLLEATFQEWSKHNIKGHVINIGSTAEWMGIESPFAEYSIQKRALRDRSLQLNSKNYIKTTHITLGGFDNGKPEHKNWLDTKYVAESIAWIIHNPCQIPLLAIIK